MKIILAKPPIPQESVMLLTVPIGLGYLGSYLKRHIPDTEVLLIDSDLEGYHSIDSFILRIKKEKPDILGITVFSHTVSIVRELVKQLSSQLGSDIILVVG